MSLSYTTTPKMDNHAPHKEFSNLIMCPHCNINTNSHNVNYAGGKRGSDPRFWCKKCERKFNIRHRSINWKACFSALYSHYFTKPHELSMVKARHHDFFLPASIKSFDASLREAKQSSSVAHEAIKRAFRHTMRKLVDKAIIKMHKKDIDNWSIIINQYDSQKCYELDFLLHKAENCGFTFLSQHDKVNPIIQCTVCRETHIIKYGFSNVGRRRFKCVDCNRSFVLKSRHLFSLNYVKEQMMMLMLRSFRVKKEELHKLDELCSGLARKFIDMDNMAKLDRKLKKEFVISEMFRRYEIELFVGKFIKNRALKGYILSDIHDFTPLLTDLNMTESMTVNVGKLRDIIIEHGLEQDYFF